MAQIPEYELKYLPAAAERESVTSEKDRGTRIPGALPDYGEVAVSSYDGSTSENVALTMSRDEKDYESYNAVLDLVHLIVSTVAFVIVENREIKIALGVYNLIIFYDFIKNYYCINYNGGVNLMKWWDQFTAIGAAVGVYLTIKGQWIGAVIAVLSLALRLDILFKWWEDFTAWFKTTLIGKWLT